jgi:hypothetical protein
MKRQFIAIAFPNEIGDADKMGVAPSEVQKGEEPLRQSVVTGSPWRLKGDGFWSSTHDANGQERLSKSPFPPPA